VPEEKVPDQPEADTDFIPEEPEENPGQDPGSADADAGKGSQTENNDPPGPKYVSIKKTPNGCRIDDVSEALHISNTTPFRWTQDRENGVKFREVPGQRGDERYLDPESLAAFLLRERNTIITFDEVKGVKGAHLPSHSQAAPAQ